MILFTPSPGLRATRDVSSSAALVIRIARDRTIRIQVIAESERGELDVAQNILTTVRPALQEMQRQLAERS